MLTLWYLVRSIGFAGGVWCGVNFWRCRHTRCAVTGAGWLVLSILAFTGAVLGHSVDRGDKQLVFLAVLAAGLIFKTAGWYARGSNARHGQGGAAAGRVNRMSCPGQVSG